MNESARAIETDSTSSDRRVQKRQSIAECAARLFAQEGYANCEMERVAAEAGIAKGTLYLYFPGKQELFFACVDWGMSWMQQTVRAAAETVTDPLERILVAIRAYLVFFEEHPEYVELLIQERAIFRDRKKSTYFEYRAANIGYWQSLYQELIATGRLRSDLPVERITDTIGSSLYGAMFTNRFLGRSVSLDEQYSAYLEIMFRGLLSDADREHWKLPRGSAESPVE
ncbi:MAG: TetR/AcrR family transcriptional regulator [Planctomycetes bacterium]|nr:TetR/AcrR family transcriptional regulator [Planctomycetota bacterium]